MPHALDALAGKHIAIKNPPHFGSIYYNFRGFFVILQALVDAGYIWTDTGGTWSPIQCTVVQQLKECIEDKSIQFPDDDPLPNNDRDMPYSMGYDAFPLADIPHEALQQEGSQRSNDGHKLLHFHGQVHG